MHCPALISLALTSALCLSQANAAEPLNGAAFEAATTGRTLIYALDGVDYGIETYLENREVRWSFLDGDCMEGRWYEQAGAICFVYEADPAPQCWQFRGAPGGLSARFVGDDSAEYTTRESAEPLVCLGPRVGS